MKNECVRSFVFNAPELMRRREMKKRQIGALICSLVLAASVLAGCGSSSGSSTSSSDSSQADAEEAQEGNTDSANAAGSEAAAAGEETAGAAGSTAASSQDLTITADTVNIGIQPSAAFLPLFVAQQEGWIEEALEPYGVTVNWNSFESGPPLNESLASGDSDLGVVGDVPTVSAIAAGQDNEIIATAAQAADSYAVLVAAESDYSTASDLKGKKIATVVGSTGHNLTKKFLEKDGLTLDDIDLVNISAGDAETVLSNGDVDAVAIWEPTVTRLVDDGVAKTIALGSDVGLAGTNTIVARSEFADANPGIISIIIEQYARGVAALDNLDDETLQKVADYLSLSTDQVKAIEPKYDFTVRTTQEDIDALNDTIQFLVGIEAIDKEYDIADYVNTSYADNANLDQYLK